MMMPSLITTITTTTTRTMEWLQQICIDLRSQHLTDLQIYQSSHQEWKNRLLHQVLIPVECFAMILLLTVFVHEFLQVLLLTPSTSTINAATATMMTMINIVLYVTMVLSLGGGGLGMIALILSSVDHHPWIGLLTYVYMVAATWISCFIVTNSNINNNNNNWYSIGLIAIMIWIIASLFQVVVGHWIWEQNAPDILNQNDEHVIISWLSLTHSVQIAWSS